MIESIEINLFASRMTAICEEMGLNLARAAFSPNIKDRFDFSCALFDAQGALCAQAAHIPVHLGSMAYAMLSIVESMAWYEGDVVVLNDPYLGGTHLPDVTMLAPVFVNQCLQGFVVNRAHHANIGSDTPGSMPLSSDLRDEGVVISPVKLKEAGCFNTNIVNQLAAIDGLTQLDGDFLAQLSTVEKGVEQFTTLIRQEGQAYQRKLNALNEYGQRLAKAAYSTIPNGRYRAIDTLDGDGLGQNDIRICLCLHIKNGAITADFSGTSLQVNGNVNCPLSVAAAAVYYVFRCLLPEYAPACQGVFSAISLTAPRGCLLNAQAPAAVAAGNVETSTRVVDVVLKALVQALPDLIPAASHGSMNNVAMGSRKGVHWDYYETIGGGMGASMRGAGLSAVQTHMTNTLNTPVEVLESQYPLRILDYAIRRFSGGQGEHNGGDGIVRRYQFLEDTELSLLTERRTTAPWGINAGEGAVGENMLNNQLLPGKTQVSVKAGDILTIKTPGGGAWAPSR